MRKGSCSLGNTDSGNKPRLCSLETKMRLPFIVKVPPQILIRSILCTWGIEIVQFWLDRAGLSLLVERGNQGFPAVVNSDGVNKWAKVWEAKSSFWGSSHTQSACEVPVWKWPVESLLFIKFGPSVDYEEPISSDKFFLRVHIKLIFFFRVHTMYSVVAHS